MSASTLPCAIFLMGPTACGKTELAVQLVQQLPCEIISVDSAMVYRGMNIGTAKPGPEVLRVAPHWLIDIREPESSYSAADFRKDALRTMAKLQHKGKIPLLVGGTFLYFRALEKGLARLPTASAVLRQRLEAQAKQTSWGALHKRLSNIDPIAAKRIHPNDSQRIQRALEVYELSGKTLTEWQSNAPLQPFPYRCLRLALFPQDRAKLQQHIAIRFQQMLAQGLIEEVAQLRTRPQLSSTSTAMRALGYRQVWAYLDGTIDQKTMTERAIIATRQFAKRQLTWLRGDTNLHPLLPRDSQLVSQILCLYQKFAK